MRLNETREYPDTPPRDFAGTRGKKERTSVFCRRLVFLQFLVSCIREIHQSRPLLELETES